MLVHDTAWFMDSPFPEIARRGYPTQRVEAERHVVETDLITEDVRHPALRGIEPGMQFATEFRDHMIFEPGEAGTVLMRNEFGDPVYVAGQAGEGRVIFSGCYYGYTNPLSGGEAEVFWRAVDWLAGEGPNYRPPIQRRGNGAEAAIRWPDRPMFE